MCAVIACLSNLQDASQKPGRKVVNCVCVCVCVREREREREAEGAAFLNVQDTECVQMQMLQLEIGPALGVAQKQ